MRRRMPTPGIIDKKSMKSWNSLALLASFFWIVALRLLNIVCFLKS